MNSFRTAALFLLVITTLTATALPFAFVSAAPTVVNSAKLLDVNSSSTNWSGWDIVAARGSVTDVKGTWTVPAVQGTCPSSSQYSSFWVGIDGDGSNTVEQTGTDSDCQGGHAVYYTWYEFYPKFPVNGFTVMPGDVITAEVKFTGSTFTVSLTDVTSGNHFSVSSAVKKAQRVSAEWIAEAPSGSGGVLPLANFGTVSFSSCTATISGTTGSIGSFSGASSITMVTSRGVVKASPSGLSSGGSAFTVTWKSSGP